MSIDDGAVADPETATVRRTVRIAAPVEKVWRAVAEPAQVSRWFGRVVLVGEGVGARGTITWPDDGPLPLRVEAVDPPRSISYRWCNDDAAGAPETVDDAPSTVFTFTLDAVPGGTELTVVETGFELTSDPIRNLEDHRRGWDAELDKLVALGSRL